MILQLSVIIILLLIYKYYHDHYSSAAADDRTIMFVSSAHRTTTTTTFSHEFSPIDNRLGVWLHVDGRSCSSQLYCYFYDIIIIIIIYRCSVLTNCKTCLQQFSPRRRVDISCGVHVRSLLRFVVTTDQHLHRYRCYYALGLHTVKHDGC